jgi:hypothetical protein
MRALGWAERAIRAAGGRVSGATSVANRTADAVGRQRFVHVQPNAFFGEAATSPEGKLDQLFLTVTHDEPSTVVLPIRGEDVARRMAASLQLERARLWEAYRHSLFAFPERRCSALDTAGEKELDLLLANLSEVPSHEVRHPYPVDILEVVQVMRRYLVEP